MPEKIKTKFNFAAKDQDWFAKLSPSQAEGRKGLVRQKAYAAVKEKKIVKIIYVPHIGLDRKKVLSKTNF